LNAVNGLRQKSGGSIPRSSYIHGAPETVGYFSSQITGFGLSEQSLQSEKSDFSTDAGWEKWDIEAVCTGSASNLYAFIDSLEKAEIYRDMSFSMDINDENLYDLSIKLSFYTPHA